MRDGITAPRRSKIYSALIAISLFFAPYTVLRVFRLGITEISMIMIIFFVLVSEGFHFGTRVVHKNLFSKFWFWYLIVSLIGFVYNYFFLDFSSGNLDGMLFDTFTYMFVAICCFSLESLLHSNRVLLDIWKILKIVYITSSATLFMFFVIGRLTGTQLIMYYIFFRPFATNIHHTSMFIAPLLFLGAKIFFETESVLQKVVIGILIFSNVVTGINTGSTKIYLSFIFGSLMVLVGWIFSSRTLRPVKGIVFSCLMFICALVSLLMLDQIVSYSTSFFVSNDIGGGRSLLYSSSVEKASESIIVGFGPGPHAQISEYQVGFSDAHQTHLTALLQGGVIGLSLYIALIVRVFLKCTKDIFVLGSFTAVFLYSLGGDIMRRLPMWLFLVLFYYYCLQKDENRIADRKYSNRGGYS